MFQNAIETKSTLSQSDIKVGDCNLIVFVCYFADVNECVGEGEGHTCHPSTQCVNKEGGYSCQCGSKDNCLHSTFSVLSN